MSPLIADDPEIAPATASGFWCACWTVPSLRHPDGRPCRRKGTVTYNGWFPICRPHARARLERDRCEREQSVERAAYYAEYLKERVAALGNVA